MMTEQLMYLFSTMFTIAIGCGCLAAGVWLVIRFGAMLTHPDHVAWQCALMVTLGAVLILGGLLLII